MKYILLVLVSTSLIFGQNSNQGLKVHLPLNAGNMQTSPNLPNGINGVSKHPPASGSAINCKQIKGTSFNGIDQVVELPAHSSIRTILPTTISFWLKWPGASQQPSYHASYSVVNTDSTHRNYCGYKINIDNNNRLHIH